MLHQERRNDLFPFANYAGHDFALQRQGLDGDVAYNINAQGQATRGSFLHKRAIALIMQKQVGSDPHGDIDVVEAIAIDVGHCHAFLLVCGDRRKIRMRRRLHALFVILHSRFVMLGAPRLGKVP